MHPKCRDDVLNVRPCLVVSLVLFTYRSLLLVREVYGRQIQVIVGIRGVVPITDVVVINVVLRLAFGVSLCRGGVGWGQRHIFCNIVLVQNNNAV